MDAQGRKSPDEVYSSEDLDLLCTRDNEKLIKEPEQLYRPVSDRALSRLQTFSWGVSDFFGKDTSV